MPTGTGEGAQAAEKGPSAALVRALVAAAYSQSTPPTHLWWVPARPAPPWVPAGAHALSVGSGLWALLSGLSEAERAHLRRWCGGAAAPRRARRTPAPPPPPRPP